MQFGLTMAIAVAISCLNALTLSPALCALIMTPHADASTGEKLSFSSRFHEAFNASFYTMSGKYRRAVEKLIGHRLLTAMMVIVAVVCLALFMKTTKTGLVPQEDMGTIFVNVQAAPGTSLQETFTIVEEVKKRIIDIPEIRLYSMLAGASTNFEQSSSSGSFTIKMKNWSERKGKGQDVNAIMAEIYRRTDDIANAKIQVNTGAMIPGYGRTNNLEIHLQDKQGGSIDNLERYTKLFIDSLNKREEISRAYTNFDT